MLGQLFQHGQHAARVAFADGFDVAALLEQLAADVQRQIGRIHHAFDKAQIARQQLLGVVHDEHAPHVELDAGFLRAVPQVLRGVLRDVEQLRVFGVAFHAVVAPGQRRLPVVRQVFVEVFVLRVGDVFARARPQGRGLVHGFPLAGFHHAAGLAFLRAVFPLFAFHLNGQVDVVGVLGNQLAQAPAVGKFQRVFAQVQRHARAALFAGDGGHFKVARAFAAPAHALLGRQARAARFDRDAIGHDEARVKAHAKLANQLRVLLLVAREAAHEFARAAFGDGAQIGHGLLPAHADAGICHRERARGLVKADAHAQIRLAAIQAGVRQRLKAQLVARVRSVGNQLAQEDFAVGVKRVSDQVQQLRHFGLKSVLLGI